MVGSIVTIAIGAGIVTSGASLIFNGRDDPLLSSVGFMLIGSVISFYLIPALGPSFIRIGLSGKDMGKKDKPLLPETMGAVAALVYLFCMFFFIPFMFYKYFVTSTSGGGNREEGFEESLNHERFPHNKLAEFLSAILCLQSMFILGVADDLFDIRWRNKFFLPAIASIPLLVVYYVDFGVTSVMIPSFLSFGRQTNLFDLGGFYYIYMACVAIFCPNSINILAGINGLEVGQSLVIGVCILANDFLYIFNSGHPAQESHLLSTYLLLPFIGVSASLLYHNWWPAKVFVGDTYCYFAGMVFAVVGILGHFSKTLLLFFIPQIFNFIYSVPQLFKLVECPRHRLPKFNPETGLLEPSRAPVAQPPSRSMTFILSTLANLHLLKIWTTEVTVTHSDGSKSKQDIITEMSNLTLINLMLVILGPMREDSLAFVLMGVQLATGIGAIILRHTVAIVIFGRDNI